MRTIYKLNGKKVSKKYLTSLIGEDRILNITKQAQELFKEDSYIQRDFIVACGMVTVDFY